MGSARTVTGVGPRFCFMADTSAGGATTDNLIGGVTGQRITQGKYGFQHGLGHTAYMANFIAEDGSVVLFCEILERGLNGITMGTYNASGSLTECTGFVHGIIHDSGG